MYILQAEMGLIIGAGVDWADGSAHSQVPQPLLLVVGWVYNTL